MQYRLAILILTIISLLPGTVVNAQHLIFKTYTVEDGLVSNPIRRIYQDGKGFMWIGTWEGLSKYDGNKFTNFNTANGLSHNMVNDIYESADGKLYLAENNGTVDVLQEDVMLKNEAFRNVIVNKFRILQDHRVFAATDSSGIYEIKNGKLVKTVQAFPDSTFNDLTILNDSLLIGGSRGSLYILNRRLGLSSVIHQPIVVVTNKIYRDFTNRVWVGTNKGLKLVSELHKNNASPFLLWYQPHLIFLY
ncbi:MAG: hypothetical protein IPP93_18640 [Chitinophagaceae bacterium]|nr:hypothetical protein [Chitinophagaceae bacterium]